MYLVPVDLAQYFDKPATSDKYTVQRQALTHH